MRRALAWLTGTSPRFEASARVAARHVQRHDGGELLRALAAYERDYWQARALVEQLADVVRGFTSPRVTSAGEERALHARAVRLLALVESSGMERPW